MLHSGHNEIDGVPVEVVRKRIRRINLREVKVRKDGIDLVVRGDGFKKLMGKE